jgi:hypothetical protein
MPARVMARVLERAAGETSSGTQPVRVMGVELLTVNVGGQPARAVYLEDYGRTFQRGDVGHFRIETACESVTLRIQTRPVPSTARLRRTRSGFSSCPRINGVWLDTQPVVPLSAWP